VYADNDENNGGFTLTFHHFDLESGYDYVKIYTTGYPGPYISYTGINTGLTVEISSSSFSIEFTSDGSVTESGFSVTYNYNPCANCQPFATLKYTTYSDSDWKIRIIHDTTQDVSKALKKSSDKVEVGSGHPYVIERADGSPFCVSKVEFEVACMDRVRVRILASTTVPDQDFYFDPAEGWHSITANYATPVQADKLKLTFWESPDCDPGNYLRKLTVEYCL
jgi:hypothetical protein